MTDPLDDESLEQVNAYLDGELGPEARTVFEERIARDPALEELVNRMRAANAELKTALGEVPAIPPSDALLAAVRDFTDAHAPEAQATSGTVVEFQPRKKAQRAASSGWGIPLAAGIALFVGAGGMWLTQQGLSNAVDIAAVALKDGVVLENSVLHSALEETESGSVFMRANGRIRPILSFSARDGRLCREFESISDQGAVVGVACKDDRGWKMEILLSAAPHAPDETQYAPASGFNVKALDDVVSQLMDGQAMSPEAERAAKSNGWRKSN